MDMAATQCDRVPHKMTPLVKTLRLIADPTRLRLLLLLQQEELSVAEIQEILGMGQSRISAHLGQLKQARLVRDRRAGKNIYYGNAAENPLQAQLREIVLAGAKEIPETATALMPYPYARAGLRCNHRGNAMQLSGWRKSAG